MSYTIIPNALPMAALALTTFIALVWTLWHSERRIQNLEHEVASLHVHASDTTTDSGWISIGPTTPEVARRFKDMGRLPNEMPSTGASAAEDSAARAG